jgi:WD40 repeat protein/tRNA A-37 threonylcarbamoyl transferase component Bud32
MNDSAPDLLLRLLRDQSERWRRGQPVTVEVLLKHHPALARDEEAILDLISNEIFLRSGRGDRLDLDEYRRRFPRLAMQIELQFQLHQAVAPSVSLIGAEAMPNLPGYEILAELGRGSMGVVYKARQTSLHRIVALKLLQGTEMEARFRAEAEAVARMQHPNIVQLFETGEHEGRSYFSLELLDGGTLAGKLGGKPQPERDSARLIATLARAVHYAHQRGVIHRDLKPANVLLTADSVPKIADFGLARRLNTNQRLTQLGEVVGTPCYMAPEQARGKRSKVGIPADVYALGAILYEMLTGKPPFRADTVYATLIQVATEAAEAPTSIRPGLSLDLEAICLKCLEKRPGARYASAAELADELERYLAGRPVKARPIGARERAAKWVRRTPALATVLVLLLVATGLLVGGGLFYGMRLQQERDEAARQRDEARTARQEAEWDRDTALQATRDAEQQRDATRQAQAEAGQRLEQARRALYALQLSEALTTWPRDPGRARQLLEDASRCPLDLRDFTWRLLARNDAQPLQRLRTPAAVCLAVSADGKTLATGGRDGFVRLRNTETGQERAALDAHTGRVGAVAFAPVGNMLATCGADHTVRLWNGSGVAVRTLRGHRRPVFALAFSPSGETLASAGEEGEIRLWNVKTGKELPTITGHRGAIHALVFTSDGKGVISAGEDRGIRFWEVGTREPRGILQGHADRVYALALSTDGKLLASAGGDGALRLWDVQTGALRLVLPGHVGHAYAVAFSPDGRTLVSAAEGFAVFRETPPGEVKLWDPTTGQLLGTFARPVGVLGLAFLADGKRFAITSGGEVEVWPARLSMEKLTLRDHNGPVLALAFAPDARTLATGGFDQLVKLTDVASGEVSQTLRGHKAPIAAVAFAKEKTLASASADGVIRLWDASTGKSRKTIEAHRNGVLSLSFAPDGETLVSGGQDHLVKLWHGRTGELRLVLTGHAQGVTGVAFTADGKMLASSSADGTVKLWRISGGEGINTLKVPGEGVQSLGFSPDGKTLATGGVDGAIRLWDVGTGNAGLILSGHRGPVWSLCFSPDGKTLAAGSGPEDAGQLQSVGEVRLWDPVGGQLRAVLSGHGQAVVAVAFSGDGRMLASASLDQTVKLWEAAPADAPIVLTRHAGPVRAMAVSADGRTLLSVADVPPPASRNAGVVTLCDAMSGKEFASIVGHTAPVQCIAFSPDGQTGASGDAAGAIKVWNTTTGKEAVPALRLHAGPVLALAFGPGSKLLVSGGWDGTVKVFDTVGKGERAILRGHVGPVLALAVNADGDRIASAGWDGTVRLWDAATGKARAILRGHAGLVRAVAFSSDGKQLASGAGSADRLHHNRIGEVILWDMTTSKPRTIFAAHPRTVAGLVFSSDGKRLLTACDRGTDDRGELKEWDTSSGKELSSLPWPQGAAGWTALTPRGQPLLLADAGSGLFVWDAAAKRKRPLKLTSMPSMTTAGFSPDGQTIALGGSVPEKPTPRSGEARILNLTTGEPLAVFHEPNAEIRSASLSADGLTALTGNSDGTARLWDARTGQVRATLEASSTVVEAVAITPDGRTAATAIGGDVRLWNTATGKPASDLNGEQIAIRAMVFSPDGKSIIALGREGKLLLWDLTTGKLTSKSVPTGAMAIAADGKTLAGMSAGQIRLWDAVTGREIAAYPVGESDVIALTILPDKRTLVICGLDGAIRVWRP